MKVATNVRGFSLIELTLTMAVTLVVLGVTMTLFAGALRTRSRESSKTDALTSAQAAINVVSREIANSGYGLSNNGIVISDSNEHQIRVRANLANDNECTSEDGEDVTYLFDSVTKSIVRHSRYSTEPCKTNDPTKLVTETSVVVNRISNISFQYFDYLPSNSTPTVSTTPSNNTGRVRITVTVELENVEGQPDNQIVQFRSDVTIRNSDYMLNQY